MAEEEMVKDVENKMVLLDRQVKKDFGTRHIQFQELNRGKQNLKSDMKTLDMPYNVENYLKMRGATSDLDKSCMNKVEVT